MFETHLGAILAVGILVAFPAHAQQRFSYSPQVIADAQQKERDRQREWEACFGDQLRAGTGRQNADWHVVGAMFRACSNAEAKYVRAALKAAQRENPEPRMNPYGQIVAWDRLSNFYRYRRRDAWLDIRRKLETDAMRALALQPRCEWRFTNYATRGANYCSVGDSEMGMLIFDTDQSVP